MKQQIELNKAEENMFRIKTLNSIQIHECMAKYPNPTPVYNTDRTTLDKPSINEISNQINRFFIKKFESRLSITKEKSKTSKSTSFCAFNLRRRRVQVNHFKSQTQRQSCDCVSISQTATVPSEVLRKNSQTTLLSFFERFFTNLNKMMSNSLNHFADVHFVFIFGGN